MKFKIKIQDKIIVNDMNEKTGTYKVVGRIWDHEKGTIYELKPEPTTALEFYRLYLKEEIIKKKNELWTAFVSGSQFKKFTSRQITDISFVQW